MEMTVTVETENASPEGESKRTDRKFQIEDNKFIHVKRSGMYSRGIHRRESIFTSLSKMAIHLWKSGA